MWALILSCAPHCAVLLNQICDVWFSANDRYATQANILPYLSIQSSATSSRTQDTNGSACTQRKSSIKHRVTLPLLEDSGKLSIAAWIRQQTKINDVTSGLTVLYLKGCASGMNVIGQLPRTLCFPLNMVLHLRRQRGDRICRETLQQKTKWKWLALYTSWQQPTVRGLNFTLCHAGAFVGKQYGQKYMCQDCLSWSDHLKRRTLKGHTNLFPQQLYWMLEDLK